VASSKDRERKLARAKIERQQTRRAEHARKQRAVQARIGAGLALLLIFVGISWSQNWYGIFEHKTPLDASGCTWSSVNSSTMTKTGTPPALKTKTTGTRDLTIKLNDSTVDVALDATNAPCSAESFTYLAGKHFFDNTKCHRLVDQSAYLLQCGDPSGTGSGGPSYQYADENLPVDFKPAATPSPSASASADPSAAADEPLVIYPAGTVAMANSGADTNGSQFYIVYKDSPLKPDFSVVGKVTSGLDVITNIAKGGVQPGSDGTVPAEGAPKTTATITSLTVTNPGATSPSPSGAPSPSASASTQS
jgi:peptidyl-prolyl cis-trans isomerase B (cyclophilin B)